MFRSTPAPLRRIGLTAAAGMILIVGAACSDSSSGTDPMAGHSMPPTQASGSPTASAEKPANRDDVAFAAMMIPHHEQAVWMSDTLLAKKGLDPEVQTLAEQIRAAQQPEIDTMKRWLEEWGTPPDHSQMDHGDDNGGMMTPEEMRELRDETDAEQAQQQFLEAMIKHHQGAVTMAQAEVEKGKNAEAIAMAKTIIATQQEEITTMEGILDRL
ncbi:DUF305 domain-containing protein [Microlunatus sp. GCM10028923]|uniref:DUF305 domain-containing protein n=1 Tax=Microlunatus sp. GCM10028923 TaxID=3273400 RepID=UPI00360D13EB